MAFSKWIPVREGSITLHRIPRVELPEAYPNQFLYDDNGFISFVDHVDADYVYVAVDSRDNLMNQRFLGAGPSEFRAGDGYAPSG
jgi:PhoH-like ATPase